MKKILIFIVILLITFSVNCQVQLTDSNIDYYTADLAMGANYKTLENAKNRDGSLKFPGFVEALKNITRGQSSGSSRYIELNNHKSGHATVVEIDPSRAKNRRYKYLGKDMTVLNPNINDHKMVYDSETGVIALAGCGNIVVDGMVHHVIYNFDNTGNTDLYEEDFIPYSPPAVTTTTTTVPSTTGPTTVNVYCEPCQKDKITQQGGVTQPDNQDFSNYGNFGTGTYGQGPSHSSGSQQNYNDNFATCTYAKDNFPQLYNQYLQTGKLSTFNVLSGPQKRLAKKCVSGKSYFGRNWGWIAPVALSALGTGAYLLSSAPTQKVRVVNPNNPTIKPDGPIHNPSSIKFGATVINNQGFNALGLGFGVKF